MAIISNSVSLAAALDARKGGVHRGLPPLAIYWTLRKHGSAIASMTEQGCGYRVIRRRIGESASLMTIRTSVARMREDNVYRIVGKGSWDELAALLFVNFPSYETMDFFKTYVFPGEAGYDAWQSMVRATANHRGRKKGSKNRTAPGEGGQKAPAPRPKPVHAGVSRPTAPTVGEDAHAVAGSNTRTRELSGRRIIA
jgi:hypothetical protein